MQKIVFILFAVMALMLGNYVPANADHGHGGHGHGHFGVVIGPGWGPWWGPYPYAYPYYPYPYAASPVIIQKEPVYLEPQPQEEHYWYFCKDPKGYYPYVKQCPNGWMKVVPSPTPQGPEE